MCVHWHLRSQSRRIAQALPKWLRSLYFYSICWSVRTSSNTIYFLVCREKQTLGVWPKKDGTHSALIDTLNNGPLGARTVAAQLTVPNAHMWHVTCQTHSKPLPACRNKLTSSFRGWASGMFCNVWPRSCLPIPAPKRPFTHLSTIGATAARPLEYKPTNSPWIVSRKLFANFFPVASST